MNNMNPKDKPSLQNVIARPHTTANTTKPSTKHQKTRPATTVAKKSVPGIHILFSSFYFIAVAPAPVVASNPKIDSKQQSRQDFADAASVIIHENVEQKTNFQVEQVATQKAASVEKVEPQVEEAKPLKASSEKISGSQKKLSGSQHSVKGSQKLSGSQNALKSSQPKLSPLSQEPAANTETAA